MPVNVVEGQLEGFPDTNIELREHHDDRTVSFTVSGASVDGAQACVKFVGIDGLGEVGKATQHRQDRLGYVGDSVAFNFDPSKYLHGRAARF